MVLEEFSKEKDSIINPWNFIERLPGIPKVAISCYSFVTFDRMLASFERSEQIWVFKVANQSIPVYKVERNGKEYVLFNCDVGAPAAAGCVEELYQLGIETMIIFGTCGVLDSSIDDCAIIIPDVAVRDEGTSYHYVPASDEIEVNKTISKDGITVPSIMDTFIALLEETGINYTKGKVWTTDAIYRETKEKMEKRKESGCICVDMECSALAAVAQFRGKNMFSFFYAADNLDTDEWDSRSLGNHDKVEEKDAIAELAIQLAERITKEKKTEAEIKKADRENLKEILELQYLAYQSEAALFGGKKIPPLTETLEEIEEEYEQGIVLKMTDADGRIIGSVRAKEEDGTVYVGKLMVHPDYQKRGYGTRLLLSIEKYFNEKRYELFTSTRSLANIRMYERMGYNSFDTKEVDAELKFVYMEKSIMN